MPVASSGVCHTKTDRPDFVVADANAEDDSVASRRRRRRRRYQAGNMR
jgi:hypothetical protein